MKSFIVSVLLLLSISTNLNAQTKRYQFSYRSGIDSTGKPIFKQGLTDAFGKLVIYPFYDFISWDETLNLARGSIRDQKNIYYTGYVDSLGFVKIPFKYANLGWFNEDKIARFYNEVPKNTGLGFGDYSSLYGSTEKVYGFINITGTEILKNITTKGISADAPDFSEGLIPLGNMVMTLFSSIGQDAEKKKRYDLVSSYGNYQYSYYDIYQKPILKGINNSSVDSLMFISAKQFYKGLAAVKYPGANWKKEELYKKRNDYCLINKEGKIIVPPKYYDIDFYYQGSPRVSIYDSVTKKVLYGLIDSTGKEIVSPRYRNLENFYEGYIQVAIEDDKSPNKRLWGIVDKKTGKEIIPCKYESVGTVSEGMVAIKEGGLWGFVNLKGELIIAPKYAGHTSLQFKGGLAVVTADTGINRKYGAIDKTGKTVIPIVFDELADFSEGLALANKGKIVKKGQYSWQRDVVAAGKYGYINKTGKVVIPFEYDGGGYFTKGFANVLKDSINFSIDINGKNTLAAAPRILYVYNAGLIEISNKNYKAALPYLNEASAGGYGEADYSLGLMYYVGTDITPKNLTEALKLWNKAAAKNIANAQYGLGLMYAKGEGVALNTADALAWFTKAASNNHLDAVCELGVLHETGQWGLPVNLVESIKYYTQAANLGNPRGMYLMGLAYYNGKGVTKNMQTCRTWWEKAAARSYKPAQDALKQYGGILK
ncbi:MAG: hypothetical protein RL135_429 [Bacteroidota bacterium]|jgi:hypothetical protein